MKILFERRVEWTESTREERGLRCRKYRGIGWSTRLYEEGMPFVSQQRLRKDKKFDVRYLSCDVDLPSPQGTSSSIVTSRVTYIPSMASASPEST